MSNSRIFTLTAAVGAGLLLAGSLMSKRTGIFPHDIVATFNVGSLTRVATTSCGQCHLVPNGGVTVTATPGSRSLLVGQTTPFTITGSSAIPSGTGGFSADATAGTFIAGATTRVNPAGDAITHQNSGARTWSFSYQAPSTGGLIEIYPVVNTTNNNNQNTGDAWGFHGSDSAAAVNTPVRLYANAATGVTPTGTSCPDGFGNHSVLGVPEVPSVGNANFRIEAFGMAPSAPLLLMLSIGGNVPGFDLAPAGAPGCVLRTTMQLQAVAGTSGGSAQRADGALTVPLPIPNDVNLRGLTFAVQFGYIDNNSPRPFPFTVTNGVECTIQ